MPISTAAAQPLPAVSAPQQAASSPLPATSAPQAVTVPVTPAYNAITVQLQPDAKPTSWFDPTILGPLVSAIAILATYIGTQRNTNNQIRAAQKNIDLQMENTRKQAVLDRTSKARAEILGEFIDDFKRTAKLIGDLPNKPELDGSNIEELLAMNATVNKLWLWAEVDTVHHVRELQADLNELFFDAMLERRPVLTMYPLIAKAREKVADTEDKFKHTTYANATGRKAAEEVILAASLELANIRQEDTRRRGVYLEFIGARQSALMDRMNMLMKMARAELHVEGDTTKLDVQTEEIKKRVQAAIKRVQDAINPRMISTTVAKNSGNSSMDE
ncbi:hypothetical protein J2W35_002115 [Variovorax boronicumulans]|uniref:hypothetical protein n=1 Tax=Variovorax boronicumulans TaxID=436515 RepID=UPI0027889344|nr:hypothetical protein [Variovorax boronicumulans]MDQ0081776.1 hypothetical protein [Variovorax boronicumulans]